MEERGKYLDRAVIDQETIQLLESFTGAIRLVKGHVCDTAALRVGTVRKLNSLDRAHRLNEVFL